MATRRKCMESEDLMCTLQCIINSVHFAHKEPMQVVATSMFRQLTHTKEFQKVPLVGATEALHGGYYVLDE